MRKSSYARDMDRSMCAPSKNYRESVNMQVVIDANTRLTVAVGRHTGQPQTTARPTVTRRSTGNATAPPSWPTVATEATRGDHALSHTTQRQPAARLETRLQHRPPACACRVEHALAHMKAWNVLRNCRRKRHGVWYATRGVAQTRNLAMTH
jgi:hypothetical protein